MIFRTIGVRLEWIHGSDAGDANAGRLVLSVIILSRRMADLKCQEAGIGDTALGVTARPTGRANIFFTRTSEFATRHYLDGARLLGTTPVTLHLDAASPLFLRLAGYREERIEAHRDDRTLRAVLRPLPRPVAPSRPAPPPKKKNGIGLDD